MFTFAAEIHYKPLKTETIMKKILTVIALVVAMATPSQAQIKFGITAGLNMSNVSTKSEMVNQVTAAAKSRTDFFVGPTVKFTLPIIGLGLDASAVYDQRSAKIDGTDETIKSQSIQVPINVRYGIGLGSLAEVFAFIGPQFGFNVGGGKDFGASEWTLKSSNASANIGVGATILSKLQAKINYNFALGKTGEIKNVVGTAKQVVGSAKANSWQVSLAYFF